MVLSLLVIIIGKILIWIIQKYQNNISFILSHRCRFKKTCSQYGIESILQFGILKGIWMTFMRVLKCHPYTLNKKCSIFHIFRHSKHK